MSKKKVIITSSILGTLTILVGTFFIYTGIYYHADKDRINKYLESKDVTINEINKAIEIKGKEEKAGIIFYPGGKVEYTAYEPLLASISEQGYTSILVHMPFNLAIFNKGAADRYIKEYPGITKWYLMGHSLGGVMASTYFASTSNSYYYSGLILLGAYPDKDLSSSNINLLSIYGSEDKVMNKEKYEESKAKWPLKHQEYVINGGCHAGYAMYGEQKGDGIPSITTEEQIDIASSVILDFLTK